MQIEGQFWIGIILGILVGAIILWFLDRRHQKVMKKLVESRRKIERQRTQAVNDLFALRAEVEEGVYQAPAEPVADQSAGPDPRLVAEMANLRSLIARADGALTSARRKRDQHEAEIKRLRTLLEEHQGENVINFRPQDRPDNPGAASKPGNLAL